MVDECSDVSTVVDQRIYQKYSKVFFTTPKNVFNMPTIARASSRHKLVCMSSSCSEFSNFEDTRPEVYTATNVLRFHLKRGVVVKHFRHNYSIHTELRI